MIAGRLRHQVTITHDIKTKSNTGAEIKTPVLFAVVRTEVRDLKSELRFMSQSFNSIVTKQLFIRYIPGLKAGMRFEFDGVKYQIEPPLDKRGTKRQLEILASEVLNG